MQIPPFHTDFRRRPTVSVRVGDSLLIGSDHPVVLQSMTNTTTSDIPASLDQIRQLANAGAQLVRLTAQGEREANAIGQMRQQLRADGILTPLVADIHFNTRAAFAAASRVDKVRINPGNFIDPGRVFKTVEYTDDEYAREIERLDSVFSSFLEECRRNGTAVRLGVNHGSLSDRIMSRYGDTPDGMVQSVMEFLRVARRVDFNDIVISIKASNVTVMVSTVLLLVRAMDAEQMHFPLHLGVTEAGDGEDARIKSALGIGSLLALGIGDTIRVSLSENPVNEIPVARAIVDYVNAMPSLSGTVIPRQRSANVPKVYSAQPFNPLPDEDRIPDGSLSELPAEDIITLSSPGDARRALLELSATPGRPAILCARYRGLTADEVAIRASIDLGLLLLMGYGDAVCIDADTLSPQQHVNLAFSILQACRLRITRNDYIACPGCGRTLFDLEQTLRRVKESTAHLRGLKIGVMGCIVNGPGEMADADYGYVGAGRGRVSLYRGKVCVKKNIPQQDAIPELLRLIQSDHP